MAIVRQVNVSGPVHPTSLHARKTVSMSSFICAALTEAHTGGDQQSDGISNDDRDDQGLAHSLTSYDGKCTSCPG
jgi:hypothetical protein